jgi:thiosulfate:glutathione sulfurtransferase
METVTYNELRSLINSKEKYVLIDVRTEDETKNGKIKSSVNIPVQNLEKTFSLQGIEFKKLLLIEKPKKDELIVCYCHSGSRSNYAAKYLLSIGYKNVKNYNGSWIEWNSKILE